MCLFILYVCVCLHVCMCKCVYVSLYACCFDSNFLLKTLDTKMFDMNRVGGAMIEVGGVTITKQKEC